MKSLKRGRTIKLQIAILVLACQLATLAFVVVYALPNDNPHPRVNDSMSKVAYETEATTDSISDNTTVISNPDAVPVKWTFMVYVDADDSNLEEQAIGDFLEMAEVGSNKDVNIVVQLDRISGEDASYGDWSDCRRFLITEGLTPDDMSAAVAVGEVNMGDAATLVDFAGWTAYNYPAEHYALIISSHGKGWLGCCWDETSGNDNLNLMELRSALSDVNNLLGKPLDVLGFDACLMGMTEVACEVKDYASVLVASENAEPSSGWPYDSILAQLTGAPDMNSDQLATAIVDHYYVDHAPTNYTMAAIDLTKVDTLIGTFNNLAQSLVVYGDSNSETVKQYAEETMAAIDEAVSYEKHGTRWPDSHGIAIYFPKEMNVFDSAYNANTASLANDTGWEEFLLGYYASTDNGWITTARSQAQAYYCKEHIDLYDFCQHLIDSEP